MGNKFKIVQKWGLDRFGQESFLPNRRNFQD